MEVQREGREPGWATGLCLAITGVPHADRTGVQELVERAGGTYSPTLSRRCTHLAVPGGDASAAAAAGAGASDKLSVAWRNRQKWGLQIVDLRWLLACAEAQRRLDEAAFALPQPPAIQEQATRNAVSAQRAASKGGASSVQQQQEQQRPGAHLPQATLAAAAARSARAPDPLRQPVNSRPISAFPRQPAAPSLQTQAPSVKRSVHWGADVSEGSAAGGGAASSAAYAAAVAVLPAEVERAAVRRDEDGGCVRTAQLCLRTFLHEAEIDYGRLPMTQAGFIPATDLLEQLRASTAGLPPAASKPAQQAQRATSAFPSPQPWHGHGQEQQQPIGMAANSPLPGRPVVPSPGAPQAPPGRPGPAHVAPSISELQHQQQAAHQQQHQQQQAVQQPRLSTEDLLAQIQRPAPAAVQQQPHVQRSSGPSTASLLEQLQRKAPAAATEQQQWRQPGPTTAELLHQLHARAELPPQQSAPQQTQRPPTPPTAELLERLHARGVAPPPPAAAGPPAAYAVAGPSTVDRLPAGSSAAAPRRDLEALLQQLQQLPPAPGAQVPAQAAGRSAQEPAPPSEPAAAAAGAAGAPALPHVHAETAAAAASQLAAQLRGLLQDGQPAQGTSATEGAGSGGGRSTHDLLALLRQQQQQRHQQALQPQMAGESVQPSPAIAAAPAVANATHAAASQPAEPAAGGGPTTDELLQRLRGLAEQDSFTPLQQRQQAAGASCNQELPPAKFARQASPGGQIQHPEAAQPATPAGDAAAAADSGDGSLAPTVAETDCGISEAAAGTPASFAGSPLLAPPRPAAAAPAACAAAPSPAGSGSGEVASQASESGDKVFAGIVALVDPDLPPAEQQRVCAALQQGGGQLAAGGGLGRGVTHVVCAPEVALRWLSMGVGIVSPAWVLHSLRSGRQQRCLHVSADASRHLPGAGPAASAAAQQRSGGEAASDGGGSSVTQQQQQLSSELMLSKEARQQMLAQLSGGGGATQRQQLAAFRAAAALAQQHQQAATPAEMLSDVLWSVLDPAATARKEGQRLQRAPDPDEVVIPDSEDEEEETLPPACFVTCSQAVVDGVLWEAQDGSAGGGGGGAPGPTAAPAWLQEPVLRGPAQLTLLLPRDAAGELGLDTRCMPLPHGRGGQPELSAEGLLQLIHSYYAGQLQPQEQLQLLQAFPAAAGAAAVLRPAFLDLAPVPRGALLGPRVALEGLRKATREPGGSVYEVLLGR